MYAEALNAVRGLAPEWLPWTTAVVHPVFAWSVTFVYGWLLARREGRRLRERAKDHWTELARIHAEFAASLFTATMFFCIATVALAAWSHSPFSALELGVRCATIVVGCAAIGFGWLARFRHEFVPASRRFASAWPNFGMSLVVHGPMLTLLAIAWVVPNEPGIAWLVAGVATLLAVGGLTGGTWLFLLRRAEHVRIRELGILGDWPDERIAIVELPLAQAFAVPLSGRVAVTRDAVAALTTDELATLLRHEFAHLRARGALFRRTVLFACAAAFLAWCRPLAAWTHSFAFSFAAVPAIWIVVRMRRFVAAHEEAADRAVVDAAADVEEQRSYARALEKLHERSLVPAVFGRRMTHADLVTRMQAAGVTPSWPVPRAPVLPVLTSGMIAVVVLVVAFAYLHLRPARLDDSIDGLSHWRELVVSSDVAGHLVALGDLEAHAEEWAAALDYYRAAAAVAERAVDPCALAARLEAALGRCDTARADLDEAERRARAHRPRKGDRQWLDAARETVAEACGGSVRR